MQVKKISIEPSYTKDNGVWVLKQAKTLLPKDFSCQEESIIYFPKDVIAGNHKHPRSEAFLGVGEGLYLVWQGENGDNHEEQMNNNGELNIFVVPANVPHAIQNRGEVFAMVYELADGPQVDVQAAKIV